VIMKQIQQITWCMQFASLTQIALLRSATSHTPIPLSDSGGAENGQMIEMPIQIIREDD